MAGCDSSWMDVSVCGEFWATVGYSGQLAKFAGSVASLRENRMPALPAYQKTPALQPGSRFAAN